VGPDTLYALRVMLLTKGARGQQMKKIMILGVGGNSIDILDAINDINDINKEVIYNCVGFLDDDQDNWGKVHYGVEVLGPLSGACKHSDCFFVNGIGSSCNFYMKKDIISRTQLPKEKFSTIVHPTASVSRLARLGCGTVVLQNVTIASNVSVGDHVIILPNTVVSHDSSIDDYSCIAGGVCISGGVTIGKSCYLGANSVMLNNITVEDNCLLGMGSVALNSIEENNVVVGNPAKFLRKTIKNSGSSLACP
jgi:sugar O-acyltransferase (sialic acid O-acetyltransferase NeuD family)